MFADLSKDTLQVVKSTKCPAVITEGHQHRQVLVEFLNNSNSFLRGKPSKLPRNENWTGIVFLVHNRGC